MGLLELPSSAEGLPVEILDIVRSYSADSLFWRYMDSVNLLLKVNYINKNDRIIEAPLCLVASWTRGFAPKLLQDVEEDGEDPVVQVAIDSRGLFRIKRIPESSLTSSSKKRRNVRYIQVRALALLKEDALVQFQVFSFHIYVYS